MPRLGRPTRRGTWSDLKGTLLGGGVDRLTGAVGGGITWQAALLSKDCWEIGHSTEVLDSFRQGMCKALAMGLSSATTDASQYFILFPFDDVKELQRSTESCGRLQQLLYPPLCQSDERTPLAFPEPLALI